MPLIALGSVCVSKPLLASSWLRKSFWLFLAMFTTLGIADSASAQNEAPKACWVTEFVPGERVSHWQKGSVQRGRTFYSQKITTDGLSMPKLAALFEKHVRSSTSPLSNKSQYVSGCTMGSSYSSETYLASRGAPGYEGERGEQIAWVPAPSELAAARLAATDPKFVYMQCVLTSGLIPSSNNYYDKLLDFATTPVFMVSSRRSDDVARADAESKLTDWARTNSVKYHYKACFSASSRERLKAEYAFAMDHFRAGTQTREINFRELNFNPDFAYLPGAAAKVAEKPKPAPTKPGASGYLNVEDNGNAARAKAWDNAMLQAKREEAARKAADAAAAAKSAAKNKEILDKARAERKKRGNRQ